MDQSIQKQNIVGFQQNDTELNFDKQKIIELIEKAQREAVDIETIKEIKKKQDETMAQFMKGEISNQEHGALTDAEENLPGEAVLETLPEIMTALNILGLDEETIQKTLSHENDHMITALKYGISVKYGIIFYKTEKGLSANTFIRPNIPVTMPEDEQKQMLREIIGAPEELSPRDKRQLGL